MSDEPRQQLGGGLGEEEGVRGGRREEGSRELAAASGNHACRRRGACSAYGGRACQSAPRKKSFLPLPRLPAFPAFAGGPPREGGLVEGPGAPGWAGAPPPRGVGPETAARAR